MSKISEETNIITDLSAGTTRVPVAQGTTQGVVVLGTAARKDEDDFIPSDGGTELAVKESPGEGDTVLIFDGADDDTPKVAPFSALIGPAGQSVTVEVVEELPGEPDPNTLYVIAAAEE